MCVVVGGCKQVNPCSNQPLRHCALPPLADTSYLERRQCKTPLFCVSFPSARNRSVEFHLHFCAKHSHVTCTVYIRSAPSLSQSASTSLSRQPISVHLSQPAANQSAPGRDVTIRPANQRPAGCIMSTTENTRWRRPAGRTGGNRTTLTRQNAVSRPGLAIAGRAVGEDDRRVGKTQDVEAENV